jgi:hypothetical protein
MAPKGPRHFCSGPFGARGCAVLLATAALSACGGQTGQDSSSPPSLAAARSYVTGRSPASVAIGDLDGDGKPDLATASFRSYTLSVLANRGDASFQAKLDYATGDYPFSVAIGDLNGDGKADLAMGESRGKAELAPGEDFPGVVSVLLNNN